MAMNISPPSRPQGSATEQLERLYSYLFRMTEELNLALTGVESSGKDMLYKAVSGEGKTSGKVPSTTAEAYQQLKALVVKTATDVTSNIRKMVTEISQAYVAQSEYGTYSEYLNAIIEASAGGLAATWDSENKLVVPQSGVFDEYTAVSKLYMKLGIVGENEDGTLEAGVVIGTDLQKVTVDDHEYITSKNVYSVLTSDSLSFWQDGVKKAKVSLTDFFVEKMYVEEVVAEIVNTDAVYAKIVEAVEAHFDTIIVDDLIDAEVVKAAAAEAVEAKIGTAIIKDAQIESLDGRKIKAGTVSAAQMAADSISAEALQADSVGTAALQAKAITADKVDINSLFADEATIRNLETADISNNKSLQIAVGQISVGGVNLLRNTGDLKISDYDFDASGADAMGSYSEEDEGFRIVCASQNVRWWLGVLPVTPGAQYGMSVRYRMNSGAAPVEFQYVYRNASHEAVYYQTSANAVQTVRTEDGWTVLMDVITVPSVSDITEVRLAVRTGEDYKLYTCDYSIKKPKFEVGNRVTDWSPAPEDVDADINNVRAELTLTKNEINASVNSLSTNVETSLSLKADQATLNTTAKNLQSQIDAIPGKITLAVNNVQVGGTNLIKTAMDDLISVSVGSKWRDENKLYYQQSGLGMRMEPHSGEYNILHFLSPVLLSPGNYMLSFWCWTYAIDIQPTVRCNLWNGKERDHYFRDIKPTANDPVKYEIPVSVDYTDSMYLRFVVPEQWTAGYIYFTDVKLEKGSRATDWSPNPEEFRAGSSITLTDKEVKISTEIYIVDIVDSDGETNMLSIDKDGARMQSLVAPDVAPRYNGPTALFVNKSATSEQIASGNYYRSLADALAALSNRWIGNDVEVSVAAGTVEYGTVTLQGTAGSGMITITGDLTNHAKLVGKLRVVYSGCPVVLQNMNVDSMSGNVGIECAGSQTMVIVENCVITGKGVGAAGGRGVLVFRGAKADVHSCELYDHERALYAQQAGAIQAYDCKGNCKIGVSGGIIHASGTMPDTTTTFAPAKWAGEVFASNVSVDQGSRPSAEAEPTTVNVTASATDSWYSASGAWLNQDNVIRQGYYSGMGEWSGCFWFPTASFSGKTIKTASLTLTRTAGSGKSGEVTLTLYGITVASASGDPNSGRVSYGALGTIANGETKPFTLPAAAAQALANGSIKGFMLCANDGAVMSGRKYSTNYCKIGSSGGVLPKLSVTY